MPQKGSKSITFNGKVVDKMKLSSQKVTYEIEKYLEEKESLRRFANKITKAPDTVRVYSLGVGRVGGAGK